MQTQDELAKAIRDHMYSVDEATGSMQIATDTTAVNVSHTIHKLAFGQEYPGQVNPLDGEQLVVVISIIIINSMSVFLRCFRCCKS